MIEPVVSRRAAQSHERATVPYEHGNDSLFYTAVETDSLIVVLCTFLASSIDFY